MPWGEVEGKAGAREMPKFVFQARDRHGKVVRGEVEASSEREAALKVAERGLFVTSVVRAKEGAFPSKVTRGLTALSWALGAGPTPKELASFFHHLGYCLKAGMTVSDSIESALHHVGGRALRKALREAERFTRAGGKLSDALSFHPRLFPQVALAVLRAAEEAGRLDVACRELAEHFEFDFEISQRLKWGLLPAKFHLFFIAAVATIVARASMLMQTGLPGLPHLLGVALLVGGLAVGGLYVLKVLFRLFRLFPRAEAALDILAMNLPLIGSVRRRFAAARFASVLAMLFGSGVPIGRAIELAAEASGSPALLRAVRGAPARTRKGGSISEALAPVAPMLPPVVWDMLRTGERTGELERSLRHAANFCLEEGKTAIKQLLVVLPVVTLLIAGVVVGYFAVKFYTGYFGALLGGGGP